MDRKCTNCAFCQRFKYSSNDKTEQMRCWMEPGVCDHAFVQSIKEAENYVCEEHKFQEEHIRELYEDAKEKYENAKEKYEYYKKEMKKLDQLKTKSDGSEFSA